MTIYNQGDIVLIPFPFTDFTTFKQRPAFIISSGNFNRGQSDVIILAITSNVKEVEKTNDYILNQKEQKSANLPKPSAIKLGKVVSVDKKLIRKKLGFLDEESVRKIVERFKLIIKTK